MYLCYLSECLLCMLFLGVNLIMDTMGALALGTESPTLSLLQRLPYKRDCSLISPVVWRNIIVQSIFQLSLLSYLLVRGAQDFGSAYNHEVGSVHHLTFIFNTFVLCQGNRSWFYVLMLCVKYVIMFRSIQ